MLKGEMLSYSFADNFASCCYQHIIYCIFLQRHVSIFIHKKNLLIKLRFCAWKIHCYATPTAGIATASVFGSLMEMVFDYSYKVSARTPSKMELQYNTNMHIYILTYCE